MADDGMRGVGERAQGDVVEVVDRDGRRRRVGLRAKTVSAKRLSKRALEAGRAEYPDEGQHADRPRTRAECPPAGEPCPWVSCKHHLYLDVDERTGSMKLNFPHLEPDELRDPCALRVADRDGATLEEVGALMNITRERVRQLEARGLHRVNLRVIEHPFSYPDLAEHAPPRPTPPRTDPVAVLPPLPPEHEPEAEPIPEHRVSRALHLAGWRKTFVRKNLPARWQTPDGRVVSSAVAYREAARMLTMIGGDL